MTGMVVALPFLIWVGGGILSMHLGDLLVTGRFGRWLLSHEVVGVIYVVAGTILIGSLLGVCLRLGARPAWRPIAHVALFLWGTAVGIISWLGIHLFLS